MKRKWTALFLALSMVCALALPAQAAEEESYSDIAGHYAAGVIKTWSGWGIFKGYVDGTFRPDNTIIRAELAAVLDRVMGYQETAENTFTDLSAEAWYTDALLKLALQGIFRGDGDKRMNPEVPITRQETFAAMARALALEESGEPTGFTDDDTISDWAKGYVSAMKQAGYIEGDQNGAIRADDPITRAEVVTILDKMVGAFVNTDGTYSRDCKGNLFVNAENVTLKDMTIEGDLVITDGVGEGDVRLDNVKVKGNVILRGCGEDSFHTMPGSEVTNIIVAKTTGGVICQINESGRVIPKVYVNDGKAGVILDGDALGDVVINCDVPVIIKSKKVKTVSVAGNAKVTVEKGCTVSRFEVDKTSQNAALTVGGRVNKLVNDANIKVEKLKGGIVGSGTVASSGGGGSSTSTPPPAASVSPAPSESAKPSESPAPSESAKPSESPAPSESIKPSESPAPSESVKPSESPEPSGEPEPIEIAEVTLKLQAPEFGKIPGTATASVKGAGYTIQTQWLNADGSKPSFRWKPVGSTEEDTFTADQAYRAVLTLSPASGRTFADALKVNVIDGNGNDFTPAKVEKNGSNRVVTMVYAPTEAKEAIEGLVFATPAQAVSGKELEIAPTYTDNRLASPATYVYTWYRCEDAAGTGKMKIDGAAGSSYTVPATMTQNNEKLYYMMEISVGAKVYTSNVLTVEVKDTIDPNNIPTPVLGDISTDWNLVRMNISNIVKHSNVYYEVKYSYKIKGPAHTSLSNSGDYVNNGTDRFNSNSIYEKEDAYIAYMDIFIGDYISHVIFDQLALQMCADEPVWDFTLESIEATITPFYKKRALQEKTATRAYTFSDKEKLTYHMVNMGCGELPEAADKLQPPKNGKLLFDAGNPQGISVRFVDEWGDSRQPQGTKQIELNARSATGRCIIRIYDERWPGGWTWDAPREWIEEIQAGLVEPEGKLDFYIMDEETDTGLYWYRILLNEGNIEIQS